MYTTNATSFPGSEAQIVDLANRTGHRHVPCMSGWLPPHRVVVLKY